MPVSPDVREKYFVIAVASDLHAYETDPNEPSHLNITIPENQTHVHPISALIKLIKKEGEEISADILLCPGDLGDKAQSSGIQYAWKSIHKIGAALNAKLITAASGNHDLDSRYLTSVDAKGILMGLEPPYPLPDDAANNKYWAKNYVIHEGDNFRLVILNTCAYHGGKQDEINHGRIAESTLEFLKKELSSLPEKLVNILLCHHHPQQHMEIKLGDYDVMTNGQLLIDLLGSGDYGRWMIIHGHKHHPKITYASGVATAPVIFSAGSLCANLYRELQTRARNQFYLISLPLEEIKSFGLVGSIEAWDWASGDGWAPAAEKNSGLPSLCPFGVRVDPISLARQVAGFVSSDKVKWEYIRENLPEVSFIFPQDFVQLKKELVKTYSLEIEDLNGQPFEIGRRES